VIPASIATTIVWFFCQLGAFEIAHNAGGWWLDWTSPAVTPYLGTAVKDLIYRGLIQTWTNSSNGYEINQWTLLPLLKGSFLVYLMLVSTAYVKPRYRMMVEIALFLYYYISNDCKLFQSIDLPNADNIRFIRSTILLWCIPLRSFTTPSPYQLARPSQMAAAISLSHPHIFRSLSCLIPRI
jgi:hypothetical protein